VVDVNTYRVTATRDGDWWSLVAYEVQGREVASQSRRLDQADAAIREAIALVLDVDGDAFEVPSRRTSVTSTCPTTRSRPSSSVVP
jgi:hypothetical protein